MTSKKKFYCGDKKKLPPGYEDFGTRYQCLRKGIGTGMGIEATKHTDILTEFEIKKLAERLKISLKHQGKKKTKQQLLDEIRDKLEDQ